MDVELIRLFWYRYPKGHGNFGDELSPWLIRRLSPNSKIRYADPSLDSVAPGKQLARLTLRVVRGQVPWTKINRTPEFHSLAQRPALLAIGSVIRRAQSDRVTVWGSGVLTERDSIRAGKFAAVRGHITRNRLRELGLIVPDSVGDPAVLAPLVYPGTGERTGLIGVIPHVSHLQIVKSICPDGIHVIDLTSPVEQVIDEITSCRATVSSSLHGVIVSHAYGIPSLWANFAETRTVAISTKTPAMDSTKFRDYFSSMNITPYDNFELGSLREATNERLASLVELREGNALPSPSRMREVQAELLEVAPFSVSGIAK